MKMALDVLENTMDIRTSPGSKVCFSNPSFGYPFEGKYAQQHLSIGALYTVKETVIHSSSTEVILEEFPGLSFNSVLFSNYLLKKACNKNWPKLF